MDNKPDQSASPQQPVQPNVQPSNPVVQKDQGQPVQPTPAQPNSNAVPTSVSASPSSSPSIPSASSTQTPGSVLSQPSSSQLKPEEKKGSPLLIFLGIFIAIIIMIAGIGLYIVSKNKSAQTAVNPSPRVVSNEKKIIQSPSPSLEASVVPSINPKDSSDTQIEKDIQSTNGNIDQVTNDINNVDQGLNDKQTDLTE
jgi:hypothetical protein